MAFKLEPALSGAGQTRSQLSVAAAPYQVTFKNGKKRFCGHLSEIYRTFSQASIVAIFDRHEGAFLDLKTVWVSHRRKFIENQVER